MRLAYQRLPHRAHLGLTELGQFGDRAGRITGTHCSGQFAERRR